MSKNLAQEHVELVQIFLQLLGTDGNRRERHTSSFPSPFVIRMCMKYIPGNEGNEGTWEFTSYESNRVHAINNFVTMPAYTHMKYHKEFIIINRACWYTLFLKHELLTL